MSRVQDYNTRTASSSREVSKLTLGESFRMPFAVGEVVCAKYEIEGLLGVGSIGFVVSARRVDLGDKVALKFLRPESLANQELVARFAQEARVAASIKSEHVTQVLDVGSAGNGSPFIVMERLEGRDLSRVLSEGGPLPLPVAIEYGLEVCEALAAAHARGIVHRDIKPENLFLSELVNGEDIVKVLDFGISKAALADLFDPARLVRTSVILGSPVYMSPEQIRGSSNVDARTDIWSLGCVLYELLAGSPAFDGHSLMQLCSVILEQSPTPLTALNPQVSIELEAVVWRCLAKDPAERFQDVADLARALGELSTDGAQARVERCKFLLTSAERGPSSGRDLSEPLSARASLRGPASSRRSSPPVAIVLPEVNFRPRRGRWLAVVGTVSAFGLAAAWFLVKLEGSAQAPPTPGPEIPRREVRSSAAQLAVADPPAPSAAPVISIKPRSAPPPAPASSASDRPASVEQRSKTRTPERPPTVAVGPTRSPHRKAVADDEPDVGY